MINFLERFYKKPRRFQKLPHQFSSKTLMYRYDCITGYLDGVAEYQGDFREKDFRWDERERRDYFGEGVQYDNRKLEGIYGLARGYQDKVISLRAKNNLPILLEDHYDHFIKAFRKITDSNTISKFLSFQMKQIQP